ncbi:chemotaxis protein CheW [Herbaspirillum rhizosphaerae]|uniref:chemotaxis protein CheW n=1 Tax=Herbaspirillum rhizosphaerae TaxID=346179 RepID=UPI00067CF38B|nr:chemotaxis protein CheW [Herbaspirillum rhizosphaerae]
MSEVLQTTPALDVVVDDCWNRIGVRGDNSCPKLQDYFRCLNCPTFAAAASALLDRPVSAAGVQLSGNAQLPPAAKGMGKDTLRRGRGDATASMLVFRIGEEWLGLPTTAIVEVIEARPVHSLPHQANHAVLGLTNIRGALKICVSLGRMLGIGVDSAHAGQRLLVVAHEEQILAFPVNEVSGVHAYAADAAQSPPSTVVHTGATYTQAVIDWRDKKVGLLDCGLLFYALNRSLT